MGKINGIYAASMSIINNDLTLDVTKTIQHAEMIIDQGCHGAAIFGSTGQAQLISITEKIKLFNQLSASKYKDKYLIGTGLNSLSETINLMSVARSLNFKKFLMENKNRDYIVGLHSGFHQSIEHSAKGVNLVGYLSVPLP